jgi:2-hydroxy-3-oxopropionate reductase
MLDAPVSGGEKGAVEGTLSIMVGGSAEGFARALPLFKVMGSNIVHVGPSGAGQVTKACNQLVVAATIEAVAEALVLAERSGVDPAKVRQALMGGFAGSKILEVHGQRMLDRAFEPGFRARLHRKDARIVLDAARESRSPIPSFEAVATQLDRLVDEFGRGDLDHSALFTLLEEA